MFGDHVDQEAETSLTSTNFGLLKTFEYNATANAYRKIVRHVPVVEVNLPGIYFL